MARFVVNRLGSLTGAVAVGLLDGLGAVRLRTDVVQKARDGLGDGTNRGRSDGPSSDELGTGRGQLAVRAPESFADVCRRDWQCRRVSGRGYVRLGERRRCLPALGVKTASKLLGEYFVRCVDIIDANVVALSDVPCVEPNE